MVTGVFSATVVVVTTVIISGVMYRETRSWSHCGSWEQRPSVSARWECVSWRWPSGSWESSASEWCEEEVVEVDWREVGVEEVEGSVDALKAEI